MARAIRLSKKGFPAPNPRVGCVLAKNGRIVGEGWHSFAGGPHAEAAALRDAGAEAAGAEAFVTLEPCNHHGRQPPCTEALLAAGVRKVWYACPDPNPRVSGGGGKALRDAGIEAQEGLLRVAAAEANLAWLLAMRRKRPFVTLKAAMSLDGRVALPSGQSKWITSEAARRQARRLRAEMGAVLAGSGTVLVDDPALTARLPGHPNEPVRIVLDPERVLGHDCRVFLEPGEVWHVTARDRAAEGDLALPFGSAGFDLAMLLEELWARGVNGVLVEGGSQTLTSFLRAGLADRLELFVGNVVLGEGLAWAQGALAERLEDAARWELRHARRLGRDLWVRYEKPGLLGEYAQP
jgi:diaminohydroxyphosphoribosylaminopyrimidine deaminase / 5-amino-6-(5-phosphoribosylamino)uracil reductase